MKKNILLKLRTLTVCSTVLFPLCAITSCGSKDQSEDETAHISIDAKDKPVVGNDYTFGFKLDDGYSLNVAKSSVIFNSENNSSKDVAIGCCHIDADNKTITVPAEFVTTSNVTFNIKSEINHKLDDLTAFKEMLNNLINVDINSNINVSGFMHSDHYKADASSPEGFKKTGYTTATKIANIKSGKSETTANETIVEEGSQPETTSSKYFTSNSEDNIGCWEYFVNNTSEKYRLPIPKQSLLNIIIDVYFTKYFDFDYVLANLKYDSITNSYSAPYHKLITNCKLSFYINREKNKITSFEFYALTDGGPQPETDYYYQKDHYDINGSSQKDVVLPEIDATHGVCDASDSSWKYENNQLTGSIDLTGTSFDSTISKFIAPMDKFTNFDLSKDTFVKVSKTQFSNYNYINDVVVADGTKLKYGTHWTVVEKDSVKYIKISKNTFSSKPTKIGFVISNSIAETNEDSITFTMLQE